MSSFQLTSRLLCLLLTTLWRSAYLAVRSLQAVAVSLCPRMAGSCIYPRRAATCRGVGKPVSSFRYSLLAEPGALPGYSRLLSMRNRWIYVARRCPLLGLVMGTSDCVAPSSHVRFAHIHLRSVSPPAYTVCSAHIFVSGFLKAALRSKPLPPTTLHITYHRTGLTP